ncbi:hypothetical protein D3C78_1650910 [compost metagenome]
MRLSHNMRSVSVRYQRKPTSKANTMALEAASVAVNRPKRMPPMIITGTISAGSASISAAHNSLRQNGAPPLQPCLCDCQTATTISDRPSRMPGMMPAMNSLPTDVLLTVP